MNPELEFEKKISKIHGLGIFTKNKILRNSRYYLIPTDKIYSHPRKRCARIADKKYVSDKKILNWINHCCNPNSKLLIDKEKPFLIAIKNILPNKEITLDYNKTEIQGLKIRCFCKSKKCKKYFNYL
ncbi:MAG: SET domain-containing protein [Candidatus Paceibacterota bacterium]